MSLGFVAYLLIPVCTLLFAADSNWFTTNFSVLGSETGHQIHFLLWGLAVGFYFFWCLRRIAARMPDAPRGSWTGTLALLLLLFALTTPYLPEELPFQAGLHVIFAFFAAALLAAALFLIVLKLCHTYPGRFRSYLWGMVLIALCCLYLYHLAGMISSALEIFFTISADLMVYRLYRRVDA
ncbi:MAG: hypothetical protein Q4F28_14260 [Eubacteriales bacterium]|nr:hypothetical protein [Eubacteriales bacterium]